MENQERKKQLLLAYDELGHFVPKLLSENLFFSDYIMRAVEKNRGTLDEIIENIENLTKSYTKQDFVIIFGGKNDSAQNFEINYIALEELIENLQHTNTIILGTPYWFGKDRINKFVDMNNQHFQKICAKYSSAHFLDVNKIIHLDLGNTVIITNIWHTTVFEKVINNLSILMLKITLDQSSTANPSTENLN